MYPKIWHGFLLDRIMFHTFICFIFLLIFLLRNDMDESLDERKKKAIFREKKRTDGNLPLKFIFIDNKKWRNYHQLQTERDYNESFDWQMNLWTFNWNVCANVFWFLISFKLSFFALIWNVFSFFHTHTHKLFAFHILSCLLALKSHARIISAYFIMVRAFCACVHCAVYLVKYKLTQSINVFNDILIIFAMW